MTVTLADLGGWPALLGALISGTDLTSEQAAAAMAEILDGGATPAQVAGFVIGLRAKGETVVELTGMLETMLGAAEAVPVPPGLDPIDTCGTGGSPTRRVAAFNVSTLASFVIVGGGGVVCKHGGRAASATSSSADLLEALGVVVDLGPEGVARCLDRVRMAFCFAPRFHPAMRDTGPTRRELGVSTVFNLLGPLANPARVRRQVLGVSDPLVAERMIGVLAAGGAIRAMVVHGHDGLDELTTTTASTVRELNDGEVRTYVVEPTQLGIRKAEPAELAGGDVAANVALARRVLAGEPGPHRDLVALNAAAGLVVAGIAEDLPAGLAAAHSALDGGAAAGALDDLVRESNAAA